MHRLRDEVLGAIRALREEIREELADVKDKQATRDATCAAERQGNGEVKRQLETMWSRMDAHDTCRTCKSEARIVRMETTLAILTKVAWLMASTTVGLVMRTVWEILLTMKGVGHG